MNQRTVTGIVLNTVPIGEYDRRVVILTKEDGKISAFAKGARRPNSPLLGMITPFCFGEFDLYVGRSSYTIQQARISNYFAELRADMEGAYYGFYFLELADYFAKEGNNEQELLKLLYQTLRALKNETIPNQLVRYIYEFKLYVINGLAPNPEIDAMVQHQSTQYTLQHIAYTAAEKLYSFTVTAEVLSELGAVMKRYGQIGLDRELKSLEILETIVATD